MKRWLVIDECGSSGHSSRAGSATESDELREANKRIRFLEQENEVLRRASAYLSQANLPENDVSCLVRELAADGIPVVVTCRVLKIVRQSDDRWLADPITLAELDEAYLADAIIAWIERTYHRRR